MKVAAWKETEKEADEKNSYQARRNYTYKRRGPYGCLD